MTPRPSPLKRLPAHHNHQRPRIASHTAECGQCSTGAQFVNVGKCVMEANQPSKPAQGAALHLAAQQLVDLPPIFTDPLALKIVGDEAATELRAGRDRHADFGSAPLRAFVAVRSRFAEDALAEAYVAGVRQYAILGAGLD